MKSEYLKDQEAATRGKLPIQIKGNIVTYFDESWDESSVPNIETTANPSKGNVIAASHPSKRALSGHIFQPSEWRPVT